MQDKKAFCPANWPAAISSHGNDSVAEWIEFGDEVAQLPIGLDQRVHPAIGVHATAALLAGGRMHHLRLGCFPPRTQKTELETLKEIAPLYIKGIGVA